MKKLYILFLLSAVQYASFSQAPVVAQASGNWNNASVWSTSVVPTATDNVLIGSGVSVTITVDANCKDLSISNGGILKSDSTVKLNVKRDWKNDGTFLNGKGTVNFSGNLAQSITGTVSTEFYDLVLSSGNTLSLGASASIRHQLSLGSGTFVTTGYQCTLISDGGATAFIPALGQNARLIGNITMQRYMSSASTGWRFLGSPVRTTLADWADDFTTSGFPGSTYPNFYWCSIYSYDETVGGTSDYGYQVPGGTSDSLKPGKGYWCWIGPTPTIVSVTGVPAMGSHTFNLSLTPDAGKGEDGWNMIANPYPSPIDWDAQSWTKTGVANAIYIWDPTLEQYSSYVNGVGVNGGSNIITSSQAFWVEANQQNPVLVCNESVKASQDVSFQKSANSGLTFRLKLSGNGFKDETLISIKKGNKKEMLGTEDARKLFSDNPQAPSIGSLAGDELLTINSLPDDMNELSIPVKVKVGVSGNYSIESLVNGTVPANWCVYMEDKATAKTYDLRAEENVYFYISDTTQAARFYLHVSQPISASTKEPSCSYLNNGEAKIQFRANGAWVADWRDSSNQSVASHKNFTERDSVLTLAPGTYSVLIDHKAGVCRNLSEVITVSTSEKVSSLGAVTDNSCKKSATGKIQVRIESGVHPFTYSWSNSEKTPVLNNLAEGNYTLVVNDARGCADTSYYTVHTVSKLSADFLVEGDTESIFTGQKVSFRNTSNANMMNNWSFGAEASSSDENPVHTYTTAGTHAITLFVSDGVCSEKMTRNINVKRGIMNEISSADPKIEIKQEEEDKAEISFSLPAPAESQITVMSADGKILSSRTVMVQNGSEEVMLGESRGLYLVSVVTNGEVVLRKMIK